MINLDVSPGESISDVCAKAVDIAKREGEEVSFCFNGVAILAYPGSHAEALANIYWSARGDRPKGEKCTDCKGSGWYVGLVERRKCPTCDGEGYV